METAEERSKSGKRIVELDKKNMETAEERSKRLARVTQNAWISFPMQDVIRYYYSSELQDAFYEEARKEAYKYFWPGEWVDIPVDEKYQEYWLHQFWGTYYEEILEKARKVVKDQE